VFVARYLNEQLCNSSGNGGVFEWSSRRVSVGAYSIQKLGSLLGVLLSAVASMMADSLITGYIIASSAYYQ